MLLAGEKIDFSNHTSSGFRLTEDQINDKYQDGEMRIITETGRYPLQNIVDILSNNIKFDPDYQRRRVWTPVQKSRLIESFIMNVPIPPVFLYEVDFSKYEVMDGLQRLSTVYEFYMDRFELQGLEIWPELNGMRYSQLPAKVKSGIDRRYISTIVILKETAKTEEEQILKKFVFERLNTGGTKLTDQETRNALYDGPMNRLCINIANEYKIFHKLWNIKPYKESDLISSRSNDVLADETDGDNIKAFIRMEDVELVLRFFAYRQLEENPASKVKDILDSYLKEANEFDDNLLQELKNIYYEVMELADKLLGVKAFSMYTKKKGRFSWNNSPSKLVYDPLLLALSEYVGCTKEQEILVANKNEVKKGLECLFESQPESFDGRNSGKNDVLRRAGYFKDLLKNIIQEHTNG